ncbi:MAG: glycoside hydrolase family 43 protein [Planctomycetota bacterium]
MIRTTSAQLAIQGRVRVGCSARIAFLFLAVGAPTWSVERATAADVESRRGDWVVSGVERIADRHIRLDGNLVLEKNARLEMDGCTLEFIGSKSREHLLDWKGGTLVTRRCTLGGFVRDDGTPIHTVFHLYDGVWEATDTVVQYSYGISFGHNTGGRLVGTRLKAGPRPDAIIASGTADISLTECEFPIAVSVYTQAGGSVRLDLPVKTPVDRVFDAGNTPGIQYRMELKQTVVPDHWFLFLRNISNGKPLCDVTLGDCPKLIVSLLGHNVSGDLRLTTDLATPVEFANVRLSRADRPVNVFLWALYASGDKSNLTVHGPARICELMHRGGEMKLRGNAGLNDLVLGCTTLEVSDTAHLDLEHVHLGPTGTNTTSRGEANVEGSGRLTGRNVSVNRVTFHTKDQGSVRLDGVERQRDVVVRADGGPVELRETGEREETFTWCNPAASGPDWIRDCYILRVGDRYYMTGTRRVAGAADEPSKWPGFYFWSSADLQHWKEEGLLIRNADVKWADRSFWAPEIRWHPRKKKFYLCFNARQLRGGEQLRLGAGLAVAEKVTGPYKLLTPDEPITDNNDASLFFDDDGKDYLAQTGFNLAQIDLDTAKLVSSKRKVFAGGPAGAWDDAAKINEGSTLLKVNGTYYYFWSCNSWGYFVGYATAKNIWGPYTKNPANPIWGAAQPKWREAARLPADLPFTEVGHGTPLMGPDGRLWISGHGHVIQGGAPHPYDAPRLCLDPLEFDAATGQFRSSLTWRPQTIRFDPASAAVQRAASGPLGSVIDNYGR